MDQVWDAVVVGAGPAGCAAAYDLAAEGRRVLLLDRCEFPRSKACAGGLTMKAVRALRYSVFPVVRRWCNSVELEGGSGQRAQLRRRAPVCAMTVREELDAFCIEKTRERGAAFERVAKLRKLSQEGSTVVFAFDDNRIIRARFGVGADGVHSSVRTMAGEGGWFRTAFALEANVAYRTGERYRFPLVFDFGPVNRGYGWLFPRNDHVNVGLYIEGAGERLDRAALEAYIERRCGAGREQSRIVGQHLGLGAARYAPQPGTRILLAGDAAGFVDPLTGEGISGAIRSGQAAAAAVSAAMDGRAGLAQAFERETKALREDLRIAEHAASRFYADQAQGWRLLRAPWLPRFALKAYSDGLRLGHVLNAARAVGRVQAALRHSSA